MGRIAERLGPWRRVVVLDNAIQWGLGRVRESIEALRAAVDVGEPQEVWLDSLLGLPEKIIAEAYPDARLVLYEDGLHTYLRGEGDDPSTAPWLRKPRGIYRRLKLRARERLYPEDLSLGPMLPRHLARVVASYLWISLMISPADYQKRLPWVQLQTRFLRDTLARLSPIAEGMASAPETGRRAIMLGQCFSNYGDLSRESELDCYIGMARHLRERGYEVIWKEHPRTRQPFLGELVEAVEGVLSLPDLGPWPIELFVERLGLSACASLTLTSLFSIPLLFNLPSFSAAGCYASRFRFPNDALADLVVKVIPQIDTTATRSSARIAVETSQ